MVLLSDVDCSRGPLVLLVWFLRECVPGDTTHRIWVDTRATPSGVGRSPRLGLDSPKLVRPVTNSRSQRNRRFTPTGLGGESQYPSQCTLVRPFRTMMVPGGPGRAVCCDGNTGPLNTIPFPGTYFRLYDVYPSDSSHPLFHST